MENENQIQEVKYTPKQRILIIILNVSIFSVLSVLSALLVIENLSLNFANDAFHILSDAFFIPGILGLCFWLLLYASQEGAFDIFSYGIRKFVNYTFRKHPEETSLPKTYFDYVTLKREKKKTRFFTLLTVTGSWVILAIIFTILSSVI